MKRLWRAAVAAYGPSWQKHPHSSGGEGGITCCFPFASLMVRRTSGVVDICGSSAILFAAAKGAYDISLKTFEFCFALPLSA